MLKPSVCYKLLHYATSRLPTLVSFIISSLRRNADPSREMFLPACYKRMPSPRDITSRKVATKRPCSNSCPQSAPPKGNKMQLISSTRKNDASSSSSHPDPSATSPPARRSAHSPPHSPPSSPDSTCHSGPAAAATVWAHYSRPHSSQPSGASAAPGPWVALPPQDRQVSAG